MWSGTPSRRQILALAGTTVTAGCSAIPDDGSAIELVSGGDVWPMPGYDAARSFANADASGPRSKPSVRWERVDKDEVTDALAVGPDDVYVIDTGGLHALTKSDGAERWSYGPRNDLDTDGVGDSLVVGGSFVAVTWGVDRGSQIRAVDPGTGEELWRVDLDVRVPQHGTTVVGPPDQPVLTSDSVFTSNARGDVFAVTPERYGLELLGAGQRWHYVPDEDHGTQNSTLVAATDGLVVGVKRFMYLHSDDWRYHSTVTGLDPRNGSAKWQFGTAGDVAGFSVANGYVYLHTFSASRMTDEALDEGPAVAGGYVEPNSYLYALDASTGVPRFRLDFDEHLHLSRRAPFSPSNSLVVGTDSIYVKLGTVIVALSPDLSEEHWRADIGGAGKMMAASRTLYVETDGGETLVALNSRTGGRRWRLELPGDHPDLAAIANRSLYLRDGHRILSLRG